jgi:predicted Zn-dependent peptidase
MQTEKHVLKNGLTVLFVETNTFPSFTSLLLVGAGSRYENEKNNGIAHFFEHMAFKGTTKYPSSLHIASTIEGMGGTFNAFTDKDHTGYWIKAPSQHFETVIDVMSQMLLHSLLLEDEIEREKGVIIEEMNMYEDTPARKVGDLLDSMVYKGSPLGFDIIGTKETVSSFTRKTFLDYMEELYAPSNAVLVVAGGFHGTDYGKTYLKIIEDKFGSWKDRKTHEPELVKLNQKKIQKIIKHKKTEQAHFCVSFESFPIDDPRKYALRILTALMGGGMSSRLFIEVRERRGLCYYISSGREFYFDTGSVTTQAGVPIIADKLNEAIEVTLEVHKQIAEGNVTEEEVARTKEMIKGWLLLSLEDSSSIASFVGGRQLLEHKTETPEEVIRQIDSVTREQIISVANDIFREDRLNLAVIGPFHEDEVKISFSRNT